MYSAGKVLIVEDDDNKRAQLASFLIALYPNAEVENAKSLQSGLRRAKAATFDLVLLDMTLPNYDPQPDETGGLTHPFGGREFISQLDRFEINVPVIVVTQFERIGSPPIVLTLKDIDTELNSKYPDLYRGIVYYHAALEGWRTELSAKIGAAWNNKQ